MGSPLDIPEIITARLVLRGMEVADFPAFAAIWADPVVTAQVGVPPRDRAEAWGSFLRYAGSWPLLGYGQWAVCDRESGRFLGQAGLFKAHRGHGATFDDFPESGWVLASEAQGRGLGSEAVRACLEWFDASPYRGEVVAQIDIRNAASLALAARMGFRQFGQVEVDGLMLALLRRPAPGGVSLG